MFLNLKKLKKIFFILSLFLLISFSSFIIIFQYWIYRKFGKITIEQILFILSSPHKEINTDILFWAFKLTFSLIFIFLFIYDIKYLNRFVLNKIYKSLIFIFKKCKNSKATKRIIKYILILVAIFFFILLPSINFIVPNRQNKFYYSNKQVINEKCLIAHACGQIDGNNYTNSLEAITKSIENGYKFIEIDLCLTKDNEIVAMHDFEMFNKMTKTDSTLSSLQEIKNQKIYNKYTPLTAKEINHIFNMHEDLILVTDKINNFDVLLDNFKFTKRLIVEVFSMKDYKKALKKGILYPALYFHSMSQIRDIVKYDVQMVTTDIDFFNKHKNIFEYLHKKGIVVMVFSGSEDLSVDFMKNNLGKGCSFIYINDTKPIREYTL